MPVTHRHAVHDGKTGLSHCINYCKNPEKTDQEKYVTAINCSKTFAIEEFLMIHEKFNSEISNQERICYHAWQSFDYRDKLTPQQAHEIGVKLCKELYPDFQCIVCTHLDTGHLHNHIIINSRNLEGRKLVDRLANTIEGLYGLRDMSDKIAAEYGCSIIEDAPKISRYKKKNYKYELSSNSWNVLRSKIDQLKESCNDFDEMLEHLSFDGYVIKRGKYIGVLPPGKQRNIRLKVLGKEYSEEALRSFFYEKAKMLYSYKFKDKLVCLSESELIQGCITSAENAKIAILKSEVGLIEHKNYPKYYNARYLEMKRYHELVRDIEYLNHEQILTYENLIDKLTGLHAEIEMLEYKYKKDKSRNNTLQARLEFAQTYIKHYNQFCIYKECKKLNDSYESDTTIEEFLTAKEQLGNAGIDEVREFVAECSKQKMELNKQLAKLSYLKNKASELDKLRMKGLDKDPQYIKGLSFNSTMIDENRSTDQEYCVRLPYTQQYVMLKKECVLWNHYGKRATMYLINDETYDILDHAGNKIETVNGEELEIISNNQKEVIIKKKHDQNMSVTDLSKNSVLK